jgi:2,3-dihydroxybenzoate-AMP ligase
VVAMPDPKFGEKACAFIIPVEDATIDLNEMNSFLLSREIAKFKLPECLKLVREFPTSPAGKVLRRELRRIISDEIAPAHT